jgi:BolA protein
VSSTGYVRVYDWNERGDFMSNRSERIEAALQAAFQPVALQVIDESAMHAGHAGASPGGETHYLVAMQSDQFVGVSRVARSRAVHQALAAEFGTGLHALSLRLQAPGER